MKVWIVKSDLEYLKESQNLGRTRNVEISSFRQFEDESEIEIELI